MANTPLPTDVEALKQMLLRARHELAASRHELATSRQQVAELSTTISQQQVKLQQKEHQILELLRALRGKRRERVSPDQLLLFELGELEQIMEDQQEASSIAPPPSRKKKKPRGRRLIPEGLPEEAARGGHRG